MGAETYTASCVLSETFKTIQFRPKLVCLYPPNPLKIIKFLSKLMFFHPPKAYKKFPIWYPSKNLCFHRGRRFSKISSEGFSVKMGSTKRRVFPITANESMPVDCLWRANLPERWHGGNDAGRIHREPNPSLWQKIKSTVSQRRPQGFPPVLPTQIHAFA